MERITRNPEEEREKFLKSSPLFYNEIHSFFNIVKYSLNAPEKLSLNYNFKIVVYQGIQFQYDEYQPFNLKEIKNNEVKEKFLENFLEVKKNLLYEAGFLFNNFKNYKKIKNHYEKYSEKNKNIIKKFLQAYFKYFEIRINAIEKFLTTDKTSKKEKELFSKNGKTFVQIKLNTSDLHDYILAKEIKSALPFTKKDDFEICRGICEYCAKIKCKYYMKYLNILNKNENELWFEKRSGIEIFKHNLDELEISDMIKRGSKVMEEIFEDNPRYESIEETKNDEEKNEIEKNKIAEDEKNTNNKTIETENFSVPNSSDNENINREDIEEDILKNDSEKKDLIDKKNERRDKSRKPVTIALCSIFGVILILVIFFVLSGKKFYNKPKKRTK